MILHTRARHFASLCEIEQFILEKHPTEKYIVVIVDGPESVNREASWASSFKIEDCSKIFDALAEQSR